MAIALDAIANASAEESNPSWTHTPVGTPRAVLVFIIDDGGVTDDVSAVTYGGQSMTNVTNSPVIRDGAAADDGAVHAFFLGASIPTGAQTVAVTSSAAVYGASVTYTAAADTEVQNTAGITGLFSAGAATDTLTLGGATCAVSDVWWNSVGNPANVSPLSGWTSQHEIDFGSHVGGVYTYDTVDSADVTFGVSHTGTREAAILGVAIKESAGGGPTGQPFALRHKYSTRRIGFKPGF